MEFSEFVRYFNVMIVGYVVLGMGWYLLFKGIDHLWNKWRK